MATVNCVMWASDANRLERPPREGETVEVRGKVTVYEPRGQYQLVVTSLRPAGIGKLFAAFQELKERLQKEGLFEEERKKPIPAFPRTVGVVTSSTGAAIQDILKVLGRRAPHIRVLIYPVRVQGGTAAPEIARAVGRMNALGTADVLIVGRGGGSLEDLWAFNEEVVARAIAVSRIPVISAVGHEVDFTISDFVADLRAPTPSAAAELVVRSSGDMLREISHFRSRLAAALARKAEFLRDAAHLRVRLISAFRPRIGLLRSHIHRFETAFARNRPLQRVNELRQRMDDYYGRLGRALSDRLREARHRVERLSAQLGALDPRAVLSRGYSITLDSASGRVIRAARETRPGQELRILLHEGEVKANVAGERPAPRRRMRNPVGPEGEWFGQKQDGDGE
jgi:exodeoxyribonuclease VII large subunit